MNILIITGIFPPDIGGPATYVPQIAKSLSERGHAMTVLTLSDRLDHDDSGYRHPVVRIRRDSFKPWRWIHTISKIIMAGRKSDVLFVNGLAIESVIANMILRKPMIQKVVGDWAWERATNKGWTTDPFEEFQKKTYVPRIERMKRLRTWWTKKADKIIVPSQYLACWVETWGIPKDRMTVIYNAVEPVNDVKPADIPLRMPIKLVTVGRLISLKRVDKIIESIKTLPDVGLVIVGDGPERGRLEAIAKAPGLSGRVYFAGQRSKPETLSLMAASDIFVLNSIHEAFPFVLLEAMQLGLPVIATAVGGIPELLEGSKGCQLIPPEKSPELNAAIQRAASLIGSIESKISQPEFHIPDRLKFINTVNQTEPILQAMGHSI